MPVFGFERHKNRKKLTAAMKDPYDKRADDDETHFLIRAYLNHAKLPLHCRRTLDQFTYHMLDNTERRDNTQVMFKSTKKNTRARPDRTGRCPDKGGLPVLMIDQLWLWILEDEKTVITSLPNTWESAEDYNLVRHLMKHELRGNDDRPLIKGSLDLANTIIRCSVDFLHRQGPLDVTLYDCFQSSITLIVRVWGPPSAG